MNNYKVSNRDLKIFFIVTFGLTIIMGIVMSLAFPLDMVDSFPLLQMYYPALGAMIALLLNKERQSQLPKKYFYVYIFFVISSIIYLLVKIFLLHQDPSLHLGIWLMIGSGALIIAHNIEDREKMENFGLRFRKNFKKTIPYIVLFVILYMMRIAIASLLEGDINEFIGPFKDLEVWITLITLPLSFALSFIAFLGEEYGWRYFLQSALQERVGKRKGVILLGLIWGIWHLPINMFYYSPQTSFYSVLNQLVVCVCYSVFFGLVYMKTKNIWSVTIIHYLNNNLGFILYGAEGKDLVLTWQSVVFNLVMLSIIYLPFLFSKEYNRSEDSMDILMQEKLINSVEE